MRLLTFLAVLNLLSGCSTEDVREFAAEDISEAIAESDVARVLPDSSEKTEPTTSNLSNKIFKTTKSSPRLKIVAINKPAKRNDPLKITVEIACEGSAPVALAQEQFSVRILNETTPYLFVGDAIFPDNANNIFSISPDTPIELLITTDKNRSGNNEIWSQLATGDYNLRIYINSGKSIEFDYQWLGQTYSNDYLLKID